MDWSGRRERDMTREEAVVVLNMVEAHGSLVVEAKDMAIKALEQEPILDKIIAEIETQEKWLAQAGYNAYNVDIAFNSIKLALAEMEREE